MTRNASTLPSQTPAGALTGERSDVPWTLEDVAGADRLDIPRALPAISDNATLRFAFVFAAYVAQGVPYGLLLLAIPAWFVANGASALELGGYVSAASLPWTLKFVNGFVMDRFPYLPMGKRRAWLIGAQTLIIAGLIACAIANPQASDIAMLSAFGFAINAATTFQDVAVDGLAVDLIPENQRARANGFMFGGQTIGISLSAALGGQAIAAYGLSTALIGTAGCVLVILLMILFLRERSGERLLPWTAGNSSEINRERTVTAWLPLIRKVFAAIWSRESLLVCVALFSGGAGWGLFLGAGPLISANFAGMSDVQYSSLTGSAGLVAGLLGAAALGFLADRIGIRAAGISAFIFLGAIGLAMLVLSPIWSAAWLIVAFVFAYYLVDVYLKVSTNPAAMSLCDPKVAATQFTIYMAIANLGTTVSSASLGLLDALGGEAAMMTALVVCGVAGGTAFALRTGLTAQAAVEPIVN